MAINAEDLAEGTLLRIPRGFHWRGDAQALSRPYCLEVVKVLSVSKETGAIEVQGKQLGADGTTTRKRPRYKTMVIGAVESRIEIVGRAK